MWQYHFNCPDSANKLTSSGVNKTVHRVLDLDSWYSRARDYLECREADQDQLPAQPELISGPDERPLNRHATGPSCPSGGLKGQRPTLPTQWLRGPSPSAESVLSPEGQPVSEPFKEPPYAQDVEVDVVSEVGANVGVGAHQGAVEGGPAYADHHGNQTQQQQDQAGIPTYLIYNLARSLSEAWGTPVGHSTFTSSSGVSSHGSSSSSSSTSCPSSYGGEVGEQTLVVELLQLEELDGPLVW
ncbi:hypothetical protein FQN60_015851 [Etheostoma spectabile]|uniref:DUF6729 domain-containing protein n=1 Tax=Etheostoma spectabile TaxID=54343 RepID=A0A5J5CRY8_9PERO|nr:hypothetical protein FQN60_015851 [Etheostoma spectabile]